MTTNAKFDAMVKAAERKGLVVEIHVDGNFQQAVIKRPVWNASNMLAAIRNSERVYITSYFSEFTNRHRMSFRFSGFRLDDDRKMTHQHANYAIDNLANGMDIYNDEVAA